MRVGWSGGLAGLTRIAGEKDLIGWFVGLPRLRGNVQKGG
jgi:hypothetical protein